MSGRNPTIVVVKVKYTDYYGHSFFRKILVNKDIKFSEFHNKVFIYFPLIEKIILYFKTNSILFNRKTKGKISFKKI